MGIMDFLRIKEKAPIEKANPPQVLFADESTRGGINKVLLPNFLFKPPFGTPRPKDVITLRRLGMTPQAAMAKQTIIDEVVSIPWEIKPYEEEDELSEMEKMEVDQITNFLENPNTNSESLEYLMRKMLNDVLDIDSGIWVKEFDESGTMMEIVAADGASFLKNPDIHGRYTNREDIIPDATINVNAAGSPTQYRTPLGLTIEQAKERAAYFQFGFLTSSKPIPYGKKEVVWFERNPVTQQIYGKSPIEWLQDTLQTLLFSIEYNLDYFNDNNVPKGFINLPGASEDELKAFRDRWNQLQVKTNAQGLLKKNFHRVPMTNSDNSQFVRVQFSSAELQLIEMQQWFSKLVWSSFGVTPSELGFTDDSNKATEIGQNKVFKRKAILPILRMIEFYINNDILSEWDFGDKYKFEFNTFDIDDEKNKFELYKLKLDTKLSSINEIRNMEGLDQIEGGDHNLDKDPQEMMQSVTDQNINEDQAANEKFKKETNKKTLGTSSPLVLDEFEVADIFKKLLRQKEKDILKMLRKEGKKDRLSQINVKSFEEVIKAIFNIVNFDNLKGVINNLVRGQYLKGTEKISVKFGTGVKEDSEQIQFIAKNTFENIKGMEADLQNKLRQQIKMGIMNGKSVTEMAKDVQSVFDVSEARANSIARTESNRAENFGELNAAKKTQLPEGTVMMKYISIVHDSRTSEISKAMDRKYGDKKKAIPVDDEFEVTVGGKLIKGPSPPFHVNERDTLIFFAQDKLNMKERLNQSLKQ